MNFRACKFPAGSAAEFLEPVKANFLRDNESADSKSLEVRLRKLGEKQQLRSVLNLAESHGAKTVIWELEYIDRHYLEDYAGYYSRCFIRYKRRCARAHFFKSENNSDEIIDALVEGNSSLESGFGYIGYCVIKPLPHTVIGRTALPPPQVPGASFPVSFNFGVLLGAARMGVDCALFQEQDNEVAACATTALWTALSATAIKFNHSTPSPFEITQKAGEINSFYKRSLPNTGLNHFQIAAAIKSVGLEWFYDEYSSYRTDPAHFIPYIKNIAEKESKELNEREIKEAAESAYQKLRRADTISAKCILYALLRSEIPPIVTLEYGTDENDLKSPERHAVTAVGYKLGRRRRLTKPMKIDGPFYTASRMNKLYVHDDNNGPYTTVSFKDDYVLVNGKNAESAFVSQIMVPVYHKIRTQLIDIRKFVREVDAVYDSGNAGSDDYVPVEWDVYLSDVEQLKKAQAKSKLSKDEKRKIIGASLPKFLWVVRAEIAGQPLFEVMLDATDLKQGGAVAHFVSYNGQFVADLRRQESNDPFVHSLKHPSAREFIEKLLNV